MKVIFLLVEQPGVKSNDDGDGHGKDDDDNESHWYRMVINVL
jgi:hypothetical protein